ncbi:helix-turn-helix domain-containing protein [Arthrobacter sp. NPDC080031]|uniref:winged helix-turn-helix transcriptional regulator n=1 Tax=Arthrobacter sp. NPDC080031 TaxID=3155918 RepID=UPI00344B801C
MRTPRVPDPRVCSIDAALKIIGEKWSLLIIREITFGQHRFDDIVFNTGGSRDILAARLRSLQETGLVRREPYEAKPERFEYHLTEAGEQLFTVMQSIRDWGDRYARTDPENIVSFYHDCGARLRPELICQDCGGPIDASNLHGDREVHRSDLPAS